MNKKPVDDNKALAIAAWNNAHKELKDIEAALKAKIVENTELLNFMAAAIWGVRPGDIVRVSFRGRPPVDCIVRRVCDSYGWSVNVDAKQLEFKPWLWVSVRKKNGEWSEQEQLSYQEWSVHKDASQLHPEPIQNDQQNEDG